MTMDYCRGAIIAVLHLRWMSCLSPPEYFGCLEKRHQLLTIVVRMHITPHIVTFK